MAKPPGSSNLVQRPTIQRPNETDCRRAAPRPYHASQCASKTERGITGVDCNYSARAGAFVRQLSRGPPENRGETWPPDSWNQCKRRSGYLQLAGESGLPLKHVNRPV